MCGYIECHSETNKKFRVGKLLFDMFPLNNDLGKGDAISKILFNIDLNNPLGMFKRIKMD